MNAPDERPMIQLLRSDAILKLWKIGDTYSLQVGRLRGKPTLAEGLTAEQALQGLAETMRPDVRSAALSLVTEEADEQPAQGEPCAET